MLPPEDGGLEPTPCEVPRGTCPRCDSTLVQHTIFGMPSGPEVVERAPRWLTWAGCVVGPFDRACQERRLQWAAAGAGDVLLRDWDELKRMSGATTLEAFVGWANESIELDVHIEKLPDAHSPYLELRINELGLGLDFPMVLSEFWEALD